jgi:hypothetical protein
VHGIVPSDLLGIDVDLNEPGRRDREGVAGNPAAAHTIVEARAEGQQHVGLARRLVGGIRPVAAHHADGQRMVSGQEAGALRRVGDGRAQQLGEPSDLRG